MKPYHLMNILFVLVLMCSCNQERSTISEYRDYAKELKTKSEEYTEDDWEDAAETFEKLEKKANQCKFSAKEKKQLNKLRGQCAAYIFKSVSKQAKHQMEDAMEQISDMAEGFNEALGDEGIDGLINDGNEKANKE